MDIKEELKTTEKIIFGFALNTIVGFILYAMVAFSVKYAFQLYYYLFKFQENQTMKILNNISVYVSAIFFVIYLFISLTKFTIKQYYEIKELINNERIKNEKR